MIELLISLRAYKTISGMADKGNYFVSQHESSKCRSFTHAERKTIQFGLKSPGVGSYKLPSEFGYYE